MRIVRYLDQKFYPRTDDSWDDKAFREFILEYMRADMKVLDIGAGAGIIPEMDFRGSSALVCGLDPDPRVSDNPYLDESQVGFGEEIPWPGDTFDLVFADNVLEHLADPVAVFREIHRVLKLGGIFLFKTPNRRHYMPLIARGTPLAFHRFYNRIRGRAEEDTFPTLYRANRPHDITAAAEASGLSVRLFRLIEDRPEYLRLNPILYLGGIGYERLVNSSETFSDFRILLMGALEKPQDPDRQSAAIPVDIATPFD